MSNKTAKLLPLRCLLRKVCYVLFSKRSYKNYLQANWPDWLMSVAHSFCPILNPTSLILRSTITLFYSHADPLPHWSYGPQSPRFTPILTPTPLMPTTTPFYSYPYPQHWCPQPPCFTPILTPTPLMPTTTPFYSYPYPQHWCPQPPCFTPILTPTPLMPTTNRFTHILTPNIDAHNHPVLFPSWPPPHWCPQPPRFTHILTHNIDAHNHPVLLPSWRTIEPGLSWWLVECCFTST